MRLETSDKMIPADIVERIIKKVLDMQEAEVSDLDRHQERIRMFVGVGFTKWVNEEDAEFNVLKKTTVSFEYKYGIETTKYGECHFDIYNDAQVYVRSCTYTVYTEGLWHPELIMKCHKESCILMDEEDRIASCERLWMH